MSYSLSDFVYFLSGANEIVNDYLVPGRDYNIIGNNLFVQLSSVVWGDIHSVCSGNSGMKMLDLKPLTDLKLIDIDGSVQNVLSAQNFKYGAKTSTVSGFYWNAGLFQVNDVYNLKLHNSPILDQVYFTTVQTVSVDLANNNKLSSFTFSQFSALTGVSGIFLFNNQNLDKYSLGSFLTKLQAETTRSTGQITIIPYQETPASVTALDSLTGSGWTFTFIYPRLNYVDGGFLTQEDGGYIIISN